MPMQADFTKPVSNSVFDPITLPTVVTPPFEAAMAVAHGLPEEIGLRSVTLSAAEILGMEKEYGSLKVGKKASLLITDGSPLQITSQIKGIFIDGEPHRPESRQTRFYERYRRRLHEYQQKHSK